MSGAVMLEQGGISSSRYDAGTVVSPSDATVTGNCGEHASKKAAHIVMMKMNIRIINPHKLMSGMRLIQGHDGRYVVDGGAARQGAFRAGVGVGVGVGGSSTLVPGVKGAFSPGTGGGGAGVTVRLSYARSSFT